MTLIGFSLKCDTGSGLKLDTKGELHSSHKWKL
nr:MAG TPA: hypothetical protein [Caudoviricetes sp.]